MRASIRLESAVTLCPRRSRWRPRWVARVTAYAPGNPYPLWHLDGPYRFTSRAAARDLEQTRRCGVNAAQQQYPGATVWGDSAWFTASQDALTALMKERTDG